CARKLRYLYYFDYW
nr:immunoglobulin heavy chain junction region [Mus musculus]